MIYISSEIFIAIGLILLLASFVAAPKVMKNITPLLYEGKKRSRIISFSIVVIKIVLIFVYLYFGYNFASRNDFSYTHQMLISLTLLLIALGVCLIIYFDALMISSIKRNNQELLLTNAKQLRTEKIAIRVLAQQSELRDQETGKHIERTSTFVNILAKELAKNPKVKDILTDEFVNEISLSAPLHDIGKIGIPDAILNKDGALTTEEKTKMEEHCMFGRNVLQVAEEQLGFDSFLQVAVDIASYHHENWDGTGYPFGLAGENIPISARIMALADVYDALRSQRSYKKGYTHQESVSLITAEKSKKFDPEVVDAFLSVENKFRQVFEY